MEMPVCATCSCFRVTDRTCVAHQNAIKQIIVGQRTPVSAPEPAGLFFRPTVSQIDSCNLHDEWQEWKDYQASKRIEEREQLQEGPAVMDRLSERLLTG